MLVLRFCLMTDVLLHSVPSKQSDFRGVPHPGRSIMRPKLGTGAGEENVEGRTLGRPFGAVHQLSFGTALALLVGVICSEISAS